MSERKTFCSIYCLESDRVLLLKRKKFPFAGYWVAPGGKVAGGEAPHAAAVRELAEETGLLAHSLRLRGIISENTRDQSFQSLIFYYVTENFSGERTSVCSEGELAWWPISGVAGLHIPDADQIFVPRILDLASKNVFEGHFEYDDQFRLKGQKLFVE